MLPHLDNIRSDLSVFHRVDDLDSMPCDRFWVFVSRLPAYRGALCISLRDKRDEQEPASTTAPTVEQLRALNTSTLAGPAPAAGQMVGLFSIGDPTV